MSAAFWKVFELAISVWENILLLEFCMDFMQQKPRGKKGKILWGIAVLFGLIFPALEKYPALYDRWEMWITLIWLFVYLMVGTRGSVLRKVTAAVVARAVLMMVNTAILFGGSFILQESVASFIQDQDTVRIALVLLSKISYFFVGKLLNSLLFERENLISWQWIAMGCNLVFSIIAGDTMILVVRDLPSVQMQEQKWILLCVCCIWLMCLIMYFIVQQMSKDNQTKLEYELMKEKEKYSKESMEIIKRSNEELREFKHDLKNYLLPLQEAMETMPQSEMVKVWEKINQKIEDVQTLIQTGNSYVDSMINTKITLAELIKRKEQVLEAKKNVKRARVYVKSLGGEIVIKAPTKSLATESAEMEKDGDAHLVYECVAEPDLHSKELQDAYGCTYPEEIVEKLFDAGEITPIAMECMKLAGYVNSVKLVEEVKN